MLRSPLFCYNQTTLTLSRISHFTWCTFYRQFWNTFLFRTCHYYQWRKHYRRFWRGFCTRQYLSFWLCGVYLSFTFNGAAFLFLQRAYGYKATLRNWRCLCTITVLTFLFSGHGCRGRISRCIRRIYHRFNWCLCWRFWIMGHLANAYSCFYDYYIGTNTLRTCVPFQRIYG